MLLLKYLLLSAGIAMFVIAAGILTYDAYLLIEELIFGQIVRVAFARRQDTSKPGQKN